MAASKDGSRGEMTIFPSWTDLSRLIGSSSLTVQADRSVQWTPAFKTNGQRDPMMLKLRRKGDEILQTMLQWDSFGLQCEDCRGTSKEAANGASRGLSSYLC